MVKLKVIYLTQITEVGIYKSKIFLFFFVVILVTFFFSWSSSYFLSFILGREFSLFYFLVFYINFHL